MDATGMTVVSQLITDARSRFGAYDVRVLEIDGDLLDEVMDHVLALGGSVGLDHAVVEGIEVRELPEGERTPRVYVEGDDEPRYLVSQE
jgi:hypothetical protein